MPGLAHITSGLTRGPTAEGGANLSEWGRMRWLRDPQAILTLLCAIFLVIGVALDQHFISYLSVAFGSVFALQKGWESLRERSLDVNLLMILAAIGAVIVGRPEDAAALLFLFSLSNTLENFAMSRTRSAIEGLIKLRPERALRLVDGAEEWVAIRDLSVGDVVRVAGFESIPSDGVILQGTTSVDQSARTAMKTAAARYSAARGRPRAASSARSRSMPPAIFGWASSGRIRKMTLVPSNQAIAHWMTASGKSAIIHSE